jgi:hypothetical protein
MDTRRPRRVVGIVGTYSGVELNIKYGSIPISAFRGGMVFSFFSHTLL